MKEHIEHQIIKKDGIPLFVIVPYDEYLQFQKPEKKVYFPHEVVEKSVVEETVLSRWAYAVNSLTDTWKKFFNQSCDLIGSRIFSENFSRNGRLFQRAREYDSAASRSASNTAVI